MNMNLMRVSSTWPSWTRALHPVCLPTKQEPKSMPPHDHTEGKNLVFVAKSLGWHPPPHQTFPGVSHLCLAWHLQGTAGGHPVKLWVWWGGGGCCLAGSFPQSALLCVPNDTHAANLGKVCRCMMGWHPLRVADNTIGLRMGPQGCHLRHRWGTPECHWRRIPTPNFRTVLFVNHCGHCKKKKKKVRATAICCLVSKGRQSLRHLLWAYDLLETRQWSKQTCWKYCLPVLVVLQQAPGWCHCYLRSSANTRPAPSPTQDRENGNRSDVV